MALRFLAGKLMVPASAALRRVEGSRGITYRSFQGIDHKARSAKEGLAASKEYKAPYATEEELKRLLDDHATLIQETGLYNSTQLALYLSGGTVLGVFIGSLMLRYEHRSGGKLGKMMCGIPTK